MAPSSFLSAFFQAGTENCSYKALLRQRITWLSTETSPTTKMWNHHIHYHDVTAKHCARLRRLLFIKLHVVANYALPDRSWRGSGYCLQCKHSVVKNALTVPLHVLTGWHVNILKLASGEVTKSIPPPQTVQRCVCTSKSLR